MKKVLLIISLIFFQKILAQSYTSINTEHPKATLDVKSKDGNAANVMRVSTIPNSVDRSKEFVLLAGELVDNGYEVRKINAEEVFKRFTTGIPSLRRITAVNTKGTTYRAVYPHQNVPALVDKVVFNSAPELYRFTNDNNSIEILETGYYDVLAWLGFKTIADYTGDFIVSVAKKKVGAYEFQNFKRSVVKRMSNGSAYTSTGGVGRSFSFVDRFEKGEKIILRVVVVGGPSIETLPGSLSLTISRVDKTNETVLVP